MKRLLLVVASLVVLSGCSAKLEDYAGVEPQLKLEDFFKGELVAYGMVQDYRNMVNQRFKVDMIGSWEGNEGVLDETFYYADGSTSKRIWYITKTAEGRYVGRADDVIGSADGRVVGNTLNWVYDLQIELDGEPFVITLDDWLYLIDENNMMNRTEMRKFGITVGEITIYIGKK
jgi:protein involved in sex pheromone biosynthesis